MFSILKKIFCTIATFVILGTAFYNHNIISNKDEFKLSEEYRNNTASAYTNDVNLNTNTEPAEIVQNEADSSPSNNTGNDALVENDTSKDNINNEEIPEQNNDSEAITLAFTGDILFSDYSIGGYESSGISSFMEDSLLQELTGSDYYMLNEEFPFSSRGTAVQDKQYTFCIDPKYASILKELGVDIVTLANNHALDYGTDALIDTLTTLDANDIKHVGAGKDSDAAKQAVITQIGNKTIGFLGASRVLPSNSWVAGKNTPGLFSTYDASVLEKEISTIKENCDLVIVYVHWGIEKNEYPEYYQRELAKKYIDAGADMVIGSHPHVLQGFEYYKDKPILYSLGNFLFSNSSANTVIAKADINAQNEITLSFIPCQRVNGKMQRMGDGTALFKHLNELSYGVSLDDTGTLKNNQ